MADSGEENPNPNRARKKRFRRRAETRVAKRLRLEALRARVGAGYAMDDSSTDADIAADDEASDISDTELGADQRVFEDGDGGGGDVVGDVVDCGAVNADADNVNVFSGAESSYGSGGSDNLSDSASIGSSHESGEDVEAEVQFRDDNEREMYLVASLRTWASSPGTLSMSKVDELLAVLNPLFPNVPLSHKTLLKVDGNRNIRVLPSGAEMWYSGIKENLDSVDLTKYLAKYSKITIDVNMDGLPLYKSSKMKFWPILFHLVGTKNNPFTIAIHFGKGEPGSSEDYLGDFVHEVLQLQEHGYECDGAFYPFEIRNFILDAPARQMVKCVKGHGGYSACEKCTVRGKTVEGRRTFLDLDQPKRTDISFRNQDDPAHHRGVPFLEHIDVGLVSQFRLDTMHLLYQGVMKKLIDCWLNIVGVWKLHQEIVNLVSQVSIFLRNSCPQDFNRKPRSFSEFAFFKATELRRILLYDGILVFKDLVDDNIYKHFLLFHCAIYILSSSALLPMREEARQFLTIFIQHSAAIYGEKFVVYYVHSLSHLVDECAIAGTIEEFSAFRFENALKGIKSVLRSGYKPLQQVARIHQERLQQQQSVVLQDEIGRVQVSITHHIANEVVRGSQYKKISIGGVVLRLGSRDSCFLTKDGDVVYLRNIVFRRNRIFLVGSKFLQCEDFYNYPLPSSELDIFSFIILQFIPTDDCDATFEIGLKDWVLERDASGECSIYWPPNEQQVPGMVIKRKQPNDDWAVHKAKIKRSYGTYLKARESLKGFLDDSSYETATELGRGCRRKRIRTVESSDEEMPVLKQTTKYVPSPPPVQRVNMGTNSNQSKAAKAKFQRAKEGEIKKSLETKERISKALENMTARLNVARSTTLHASTKPGQSSSSASRKLFDSPIKPVGESSKLSSSQMSFSSPKIASIVASPKKSSWNVLHSDENVHEAEGQDADDNNNGAKSPHQSISGDEYFSDHGMDVDSDIIDDPVNEVLSEVDDLEDGQIERPPTNSLSKQQSFTRYSSVESSSEKVKLPKLESQVRLLLTQSEEISSKLDMVLTNQAKIKRTLLPQEKKIMKPQKMPALPLDSVEAFNAYEEFLDDEENFTSAVYYMSGYLTNDEKGSAKVLLKKLLGNKLASQMSAEGKKGKINFNASKLHDLFEGALLTKFDVELAIAKKVVASSLKDAPWRKQSDGSYGKRQPTASKGHTPASSYLPNNLLSQRYLSVSRRFPIRPKLKLF